VSISLEQPLDVLGLDHRHHEVAALLAEGLDAALDLLAHRLRPSKVVERTEIFRAQPRHGAVGRAPLTRRDFSHRLLHGGQICGEERLAIAECRLVALIAGRRWQLDGLVARPPESNPPVPVLLPLLK